MSDQAYIVATLARGTASLGFSYSGRSGLERGCLVAISLRGHLEIGVVLGPDPQPPEAAKLLPLLELSHSQPRIGALLCELAALAAAGVHEVAGHVMLEGVVCALRLALEIADEGELSLTERSGIGKLAGRLGSGRARTLLRENGWKRICELAIRGAISLKLEFSGLPNVTRSDVRMRRWYRAELPFPVLPEDGYLPGCYLSGMEDGFDPKAWLHREQRTERWSLPPEPLAQPWQTLDWPEGWRILQDIPGLERTPLQRSACRWSELLDGQLHDICLEEILAGRRLLVILPQLWMQQRLWPTLQPLAPRISWFGSDSGISIASAILARLDSAGQVVLGGPGAWKLAAWTEFDKVVLLDPSHPQFSADREPHLDYRVALLACIAGTRCRLSLLEMGLSVFDGASGLASVRLEPPRPLDEAVLRHDGSIDPDPLPLLLRQPGIRRLVHFNRLGSSRGLRCVDCGSLVDCPNCGSRRIHFSQARHAYLCPECGHTDPRLRCAKCGLATLSSQLPGLEAVQRREGDLIIHGNGPALRPDEHTLSVIGTSQLLERLEGFDPKQIAHVHSDNSVGYIENWPQELDMLARLDALYAADASAEDWIVSERLPELLGTELDSAGLAARYMQEMGLRRMALLPPYGLVYRFRLFARDFAGAELLRRQLGDELKKLPATTVLRLGRPVVLSGHVRVSGYFVNDALTPDALQELRWRLFAQHGTLSLQPVRGPWF